MPNLSEGTGILLAGIFAAIIAVVGWLVQAAVSWIVWFYGRKAQEFERLIALRSEIGSNIQFERVYCETATIAGIVDGIRARSQSNQPLVPYTVIYRENIVFDRLKPDITSLPEQVIRPVVDYYLKSGGLDATLADQRSTFYAALSPERMIEIWNQIQKLAAVTVISGEYAIYLIDRRIRSFKQRRIVAVALLAAGAVIGSIVLKISPSGILPIQMCRDLNRSNDWIHGRILNTIDADMVTLADYA